MVKLEMHRCIHSGAAYRICNLEYSVPKETPMVFHNGSNYDYRFIIKELGEESDSLLV